MATIAPAQDVPADAAENSSTEDASAVMTKDASAVMTKQERMEKANAELKKQKEELMKKKAAKRATQEAASSQLSPGGAALKGTTGANSDAPRPSRRRGTAFVKPEAVPDAHDIAEMEKAEGQREESLTKTVNGVVIQKNPNGKVERRGTGFVKKDQIPAAHEDQEPKKRSSMCTIS